MHSSRRRPCLITTLVFAATPAVAQITGSFPNFTLSSGTETRTVYNLGNNATLTQTGGTLNADIQRIGADNFGTYNISGGVNHATNMAVASGAYFRNGSGFIGNSGSVVQSGGSVNISGGLFLATDTSYTQTASYRITGGTLTAGSIFMGGSLFSDPRLFIDGGTVTTSRIDGSGAYVYFNGGTIRLSGGTDNFINKNLGVFIWGGLVFDSNGHFGQINASLDRFDGVVTDGGVTKIGAGTLRLATRTGSGYNGGNFLRGGVLGIDEDRQLGAAGGTITFDGGALGIYGNSLANFGSRVINATTFNGGLYIDNATHTFTVGQSLSGSGGFTKSGAGTVVLSGANTLTGGTTVQAGTLRRSGAGTLGAATAALTVNGGLLDLAGAPLAVGNLSGTGGTIANNTTGTAVTLTIGTGDTGGGAFSGILADNTIGTGTLALAKVGTGWITLAGANTYSGGTAVQAGTLHFSSLAALPAAGALNVAPGATAVLPVGGAGLDADGVNAFLPSFAEGSNLGLDTSAAGSDFAFSVAGLTGSRGLVKAGSGTLVLTGAGSYTGGTGIYGGTLDLGGFTRSSGAVTLADGQLANGTLAAAAYDVRNGTISAHLVGTGATLTKTTTGTVTLSGANTYTGATTLEAGTLIVGSDANLGAAINALNITGGTLRITGTTFTGFGSRVVNASTFNGGLDIADAANVFTFASPLSGSGGLTKSGAGTLVLSGASSHTGGTFITGGTLRLADAGSLGAATGALTLSGGGTLDLGGFTRSAGAVTLADGQLANGTLAAAAYDVRNGTISAHLVGTGATLTKTTTGTVTLSGANTYTGATTLEAGTLIVGSDANLGAAINALNITGGTLRITGTTFTGFGSRVVNASTFNGGLDIADAANVFTFASPLSGSGGLTKSGAGTLVLSGATAYSGLTTVNAGTLAFQTTGVQATSFVVNSGGTLRLARNDTYGGHLSNPAATVTVHAGGLVTNQDTFNTLSNLTLNGGELRADGGANASFPSYQLKGTVTVGGSSASLISTTAAAHSAIQLGSNTAGGTTTFHVPDVTASTAADLTVSAVLRDGYGSVAPLASGLVKTGAGTLVLSGANAYTGATTLEAGTLVVGSDANLGAATNALNITGGTLRITGTTFTGFGSRVVNASTFNGGLDIADAANVFTFASPLSGSGSLTKSGAGTLVLSGATSYSGLTTVNAGTLSLQTTGIQATSFVVNSGGTLRLARNDTYGDHRSNPTATVTVHAGGFVTNQDTFNTLSNLTLNGGELRADGGFDATFPSYQLKGTVTVSGSSASRISTTAAAHSAIQLGSNTAGGTTTFHVPDVTASTAADLTVSAVLRDGYGGVAPIAPVASGLVKTGAGTLVLSAANTYTGTTTVTGGLIEINSGSSIGDGANKLTLDGGGIRWAPGYAGGVAARLNPLGAGGATFDTNGNNVLFVTGITGAGGITKTGVGTLTLSGDNTWTGGTTISGGTLAITASERLSDTGAVTVNGGTLDLGTFNETVGAFALSSGALTGTATLTAGSFAFSSASATSVSNVLAGIGGLTKTGAGSLILEGVQTYTGTTTIAAGTLQIGAGGTTGSVAGNITNNATLVFNRSNDATHAGAISGTGALVKTGAGTLTLTRANTYSGGTVVAAGTLAAGHVNAFGSGSVRVNGGTLDLGGLAVTNPLDVRGGSLSGFAAYAGTQTVSGSSHYSGTVGGTLIVANGGAANTSDATFTGPATIQSGGTLTGTGAVSSLTVQSGGTLAPGNSPGLLTVNGPLTFESGSFAVFEIAGLTRGALDGYDAINVSGIFTAGGTFSVSFIDGFFPSAPATFDFFNFTSIGGSFAQVNLPTVLGYTWDISQLLSDGTASLVVSAIPEPAAFGMFVGVTVLGLATQRRRRCQSFERLK